MINKIAVYTAIFGDYDKLIEPHYVKQLMNEVDFYCFTDNHELRSDYCQIIVVDRIYKDSQRNARYFKVTGYNFYLAKYSFCIWIDSNLKLIANSFIPFLDKYGNNDIVVYKHSTRDCLYEEGQWVLKAKRDHPFRVLRQLKYIKRQNFPSHYGLAATNFLLRKNNETVLEFNNLWWREIKNGSKRDQLSFDYCRWMLKDKIRFSYLPVLWDNNEFTVRIDHLKAYSSQHIYTTYDLITHYLLEWTLFTKRTVNHFLRRLRTN